MQYGKALETSTVDLNHLNALFNTFTMQIKQKSFPIKKEYTPQSKCCVFVASNAIQTMDIETNRLIISCLNFI